MPGTKPLVQIKNINKFYGENHVVKDLSIDVQEGEFLTILGSSGSGKSTTLRMVAGFEQPTTGEILLAGTNVADKEPFERDVNTVFQSYALFPHMTIFDNVAYGLKMKKVPKDEIRERVCNVSADGENVTLTDLMGIRKVIPGKLKKVDLMSNVILIEAC